MKIGLVCPYNLFRGGGVQECVFAIRDELVKRGHDAYILSPKPFGYSENDDKRIIFIGRARALKAARTYADVSINIEPDKIERILEKEKFDILHFHEPWIPFLSLQMMSKSDAVHVATFHAAMSERRTSRTVEKVIIPYTRSTLSYIDYMTAVSPTATNYLSSLVDSEVEIIGNGIDLKKYKMTNTHVPKKDMKTVVYIGRLEKRKGVKYLIKAVKLLENQSSEYKLVIAGDGPERDKLEEIVSKEEVSNVDFLGYISEEKKLELLATADIFCSPALYGESFGIVLLEAMASGCVIVAGNNSGYESVMTGRGQLSLVNPEDHKEFARRLKLLCEDNEIRKLWKSWAEKHVKNFDYKKIVDKYEAVYKKALNEKKKT